VAPDSACFVCGCGASESPISATKRPSPRRERRRERRRASTARLQAAEHRAQQQDRAMESYLAHLDLKQLHRVVLQNSISKTVQRQQGTGRSFKSPEKESRVLLAKVYKELNKCTFLEQLDSINCAK